MAPGDTTDRSAAAVAGWQSLAEKRGAEARDLAAQYDEAQALIAQRSAEYADLQSAYDRLANEQEPSPPPRIDHNQPRSSRNEPAEWQPSPERTLSETMAEFMRTPIPGLNDE